MKRLLLVLCLIPSLTALALAIPATVNYQGTLRDKNGVPVTGKRTMQFRITNDKGTVVYWSSGDVDVTVTNGQFAHVLNPTGVDWQAVTPYMEVSVSGQQLSPREPITGNIYAAMSASIVDGAVTTQKLAPTVQDHLVPTGAIMMFAGNCPAGWMRFMELDGRFPKGGPSYGETGGSTSHIHTVNAHSHSISQDGAHSHQLMSLTNTSTAHTGSFSIGWRIDGVSGQLLTIDGSGSESVGVATRNSDVGGTHSHGGSTGQSSPETSATSNMPPYLQVIYCQKR
jgi:hypothetical protein